MRRKIVFGLGLAGALSGSAIAQFAADRTPTAPTPPVSPTAPVSPSTPPPAAPMPPAAGIPATPTPPPTASPALPPGVRPAGSGGAYVPPVGGLGGLPSQPVKPADFAALPKEPLTPPPPRDLDIRSALGPNHPWAVKPEDGAYFICVKSYSRPAQPEPGDTGPSARELAEALGTEIRDLYRVQAFLFEYVSEERKAEMASIAAARERGRIFAQQLDKYRQEAQLKGMTFMEPENRIRFKTVKYRDQIAVLVGGFKNDEDAREALKKVRTWPSPKNKILMDGAAIVGADKNGKPVLQDGYLNPYLTAHIVPNPMIQREAATPEPEIDEFLVELNDGRPYNLLKATKGWTLAVKSFRAPVEIVGRGETPGLMKRIGISKAGDVLKASAGQAEGLAEALRKLTGKAGEPLNLEAFVLHTREASIVTIGQFDGPNDPAMTQMKQLLNSIQFRVTEDKTGFRPAANTPSLFGNNMLPMPIPKMK